jgi:Zn-dependent peptidase ImmA (M78 family)
MSVIYFRPQTLETIARKALMEYSTSYLNWEPQATPIEKIIEDVYGLSIEYKYITNDARELGRMIYDDGITTYFDKDKDDYELLRVNAGTMLIEASLLEDDKCYGRLRFTLAHELAHWLIHKKIFSGTGEAAALYNANKDDDATEWQANYLATAILMPNGQIKRCFYALRHKCKGQAQFVCEMAKVFEVSKKAMEIRLKDFSLS